MDVQIRADSEWAWTALVFTGVRFSVVLTALTVVMLFAGDLPALTVIAGMAVFLVFLIFATGIPMALWWLLRSGQVSYVVTAGEMRVCRGAKVVRRHPCADITALSLNGGLDWRELTVRNWFTHGIDGWPELSIDRVSWPTPRIFDGPRTQPAIFLWGKDRCDRAEHALRQAVTAHGAVLTDQP